MTDHLQNAIEAAEHALGEAWKEWGVSVAEATLALGVVAETMPHLERHFREKIASEIRAELPDWCPICRDLYNGMLEAMRIAKGESND